MSQAQDRQEFTLNGLEVALSGVTGGLLGRTYEGPGCLLESDAAEAGIVDLAICAPCCHSARARPGSGAEDTEWSDVAADTYSVG